jgi:hypothetical protein
MVMPPLTGIHEGGPPSLVSCVQSVRKCRDLLEYERKGSPDTRNSRDGNRKQSEIEA